MKRVLLFLATNFAIIIVLSITLRLLGIDSILASSGGLNLTALLIFSAVFGMGGSFISLAISKWMAKMSTGAKVIENPRDQIEIWLVDTVRRQARQAGIGMPEVAMYDSPDMNAFATGMSRNNSLVAVSTGLLQHMEKDEVEAVLAHEVSHIANGDMVTLTLIQGVVNTFVIFMARVIGYFVDQVLLKNQNNESSGLGIGYFVTSIIAELILGFLASSIVMWFSRKREFHADAGSARLENPQKMIAALERLQMAHTGKLPSQLTAFGIAGNKESSWKEWFMSHPPLEDRIAALKKGEYLQQR